MNCFKIIFATLVICLGSCSIFKNGTADNSQIDKYSYLESYENGYVYLNIDQIQCSELFFKNNRINEKISVHNLVKNCLIPEIKNGSTYHINQLTKLLTQMPSEDLHHISSLAKGFSNEYLFNVLMQKADECNCIEQGDYSIVSGKYAYGMLMDMINDINGFSPANYQAHNFIAVDSINSEICFGNYKIHKSYMNSLKKAHDQKLINLYGN